MSKDFGRKISKLRKLKGMTQNELADLLHVSNKAISRWETGEGYPEITILKPLADALETTVDDLLTPEEDCKKDGEPEDSNPFHSFSNAFTDSKKEYIHEEIFVTLRNAFRPKCFKEDFWSKLTIYNKIGWVCICLPVFFLIICITILLPLGLLGFFGTLPVVPLTVLSVLCLIITNICPKVGCIAAGIGLALGYFDKYDRQFKISWIIVISNLIAVYVCPILYLVLQSSIFML